MSLDSCREALLEKLHGMQQNVPHHSVLAGAALEIREMALCYFRDGDHFLAIGDRINALAAWAYGLGWLDAGCSLGIISTPPLPNDWLFSDLSLSSVDEDALLEKTTRYGRLLEAAVGSASPAPDTGTAMFEASLRFCQVGQLFCIFGKLFIPEQRRENALAAFSYGHAWLDAGVRAGLLRAGQCREIFAV